MIEVASKPETKSKKITIVLFFLSLILLLLIGGAYFGLRSIGLKKQKELEELQEQLARGENPIEKLENKLRKYKEKLNNLSLIIDSRLIGTEIFGFLEKITHKQIVWTSADIDTKKEEITLKGRAETLPVLTQQLIYLRRVPEIKSFELTNINLEGREKVIFGLNLRLSSRLFK